jgi:hypothetical protein
MGALRSAAGWEQFQHDFTDFQRQSIRREPAWRRKMTAYFPEKRSPRTGDIDFGWTFNRPVESFELTWNCAEQRPMLVLLRWRPIQD